MNPTLRQLSKAPIVLFFMYLIGCTQTTLNDTQAHDLVVSTLSLPQKINIETSPNDLDHRWRWAILEQQGIVSRNGNAMHGYSLNATDKGKQFLVGQGKQDMWGTRPLIFHSFDIDIGQITGIAINKDQAIATVRFTLKAINITPIGQALEKDINQARNCELNFKKFDSGWQLAPQQNTGDLLRKLWQQK